MFGSGTLDLLIGLIFLYFVLSVVCSAMMEALASTLAMRAKTLHEAVDSLLDQSGITLNDFFNSPHIAPLAKEDVPNIDKTTFPRRGKGIPTYVPANRFTTALLDLLTTHGTDTKGSAVSFAKLRGLSAGWTSTANNRSTANLDPTVLKPSMPAAHAALQTFMTQVASELPTSATDSARLARLREYVDRWYSDTMDRAAGWYKRKTQLCVFLFGALLCLCFNIDSIRCMQRLSHDTNTRTILSQAAATAATQPEPQDSPNLTAQDLLHKQLTAVDQTGLPLGWAQEAWPQGGIWTGQPEQFWFTKILGLLMTAFAISLGAPFWFGLLSKLVELRNAGVKPAPASDVQPPSVTSASTGTNDLPSDDSLLPPGYWHAVQREKDWDDFPPAAPYLAAAGAAAMARCSLLAYQSDLFVRSVLQASWGIDSAHYRTFLQPGGTQAFVMKKEAFSIVAFRGTQAQELADVVDDACCQLVPANDLGKGNVSVGFAASLDAVKSQLDGALKDLGALGRPIFVTGHSLGAALATLYASHLATAPSDGSSAAQVYLFTFGSPRVGDPAFAQALESALAYQKTPWLQLAQTDTATIEKLSPLSHIFRFVDHNDAVSRVPFNDQFAHAGPSLYVTPGGTVDLTMTEEKRLDGSLVDAVGDLKDFALSSLADHSCDKYLTLLEAIARAHAPRPAPAATA